MVRADCFACRYGDHDGHVEYVELPPAGMLGGYQCPCTGDCTERNKDRLNPIMDALVDAIQGSSGGGAAP